MRMKIKAVSLLAAAAMVVGCFAGCSKIGGVKPEDYSNTVVATYGDEKIYLSEANYFARNEQYGMEYYQGGGGFWSTELSAGITYESYIKDEVMAMMYQTRVLCSKAEELGISLSEKDLEKVEKYVDNYLESVDENLQKMAPMTREELLEITKRNALANRVYEKTYENIDREVSDEEAKQMTITYIYVPIDEEAGEEASEKAKDYAYTRVSGGEDMQTVADEFSYTKNSISFGDGDYDNEIGKTARSLAVGEYGVAEIEGRGWYIIHLDTDFDKDATEKKKESIIKERENEAFSETYKTWQDEGKKFKAKEDVWALVSFNDSVYIAPETTAAQTNGEETSAPETSASETSAS